MTGSCDIPITPSSEAKSWILGFCLRAEYDDIAYKKRFEVDDSFQLSFNLIKFKL